MENYPELKKITVILFLCCIIAKPLYVVSVLGNYYTNIEEIIEKYCVNKEEPKLQCNGKCHLAKQLNQSAPTTEDQNVAINLTESFVMLYCQDDVAIDINPVRSFIKQLTNGYSPSFYSQYIDIVSPPPELI